MENHAYLEAVLSRINASGISINLKKCRFAQIEIEILGNLVSEGKIKPIAERTEAISNYKNPNTVMELRSFIGLVGYCRAFISHYSGIVAPLIDMLKVSQKSLPKPSRGR